MAENNGTGKIGLGWAALGAITSSATVGFIVFGIASSAVDKLQIALAKHEDKEWHAGARSAASKSQSEQRQQAEAIMGKLDKNVFAEHKEAVQRQFEYLRKVCGIRDMPR